MAFPENIQSLIDDFAYLNNWEDRYGYIIDLGKNLPEFPAEARTAENKVNGCASQVWLLSDYDPDTNILTFYADSDAFIVKGLVAIVLEIFSGRTPQEILDLNADDILARLSLSENLSSQRANGLKAMIARIKEEAEARA